MPNLKSVICTVFERTYHLGVGALVNSLYQVGYRGTLYAAYRGALPPWVPDAAARSGQDYSFEAAPGLEIFFAFQDTEEMLANIKPAVIRQVWSRYEDQGLENVFYVDCDIVIKASWEHFENWAAGGVAMVEDMNSPFNIHHPLRKQWRDYYAGFGIDYRPVDSIYVNGGFVGINRRFREFGDLWDTLQKHMKAYTGMQDQIGIADRWNMFHFMDQDALNVAKDLTPEVSIMGSDAMDFGRLGYVMSHAAGRTKPWEKTFLRNILQDGARPSNSDKLFWQHVESPIRLFPPALVKRKQTSLKLASFIGRFMSRR